MSDSQLFVGLDVHKATIAVAVAEQGRTGEVRYVGNFPNRPTSIITQLKRFAERYGSIECVYEAGPCAYTLSEEHRSTDGADFTLLSEEDRIGEGTSLTLANEHFVAQIASVRLKVTPTIPAGLNIERKPGNWNNQLIQNWPPENTVVHWPPPIPFTNGGPDGYFYLMDRWRQGDEVTRITKDSIR